MACIRIERIVNGYIVHASDPKIEAENEKRSPSTVWRDPCREYAFKGDKGLADALAFVGSIADKALPEPQEDPDPFASAFKKASSEKEDK